jgi:hypothetical protein
MPDNDMGNPKNITNKTFEEAAKAAGESPEEAKKNTLELLEKTLGEKPKAKEQKGWRPRAMIKLKRAYEKPAEESTRWLRCLRLAIT